ncbi:MAG: GEVED domain-containing protein [Candidatus Competibacteraceae bacterium]
MNQTFNYFSESSRPGRVLSGGATLALATLLAMPAQAAPIGTILGSARDFTAFAASPTATRDFQFNRSIVRGAVGFGPRIKPVVGDGSQLLGDCLYDPSLPLNPCLAITNQTGNKIPTELAPIVQDIKDAAAFVRSLPPTRTIKGDLTSTTKPPIKSVGPGSVNVIKVTGKIKFSAPLTITGGPTDYFLFNVAGTLECSKAQVIQLQGGVPATNVLFVHGDRVATSGNCGWNGTTITTKVGADNNVGSVTIPKGAILVPDGRLVVAGGANITGEPFTVYDYGDAPDNYGTTYSAQGARHALGARGPRLGNLIDAETNGQPTAGADGDDKSGYAPDDEDGIVPSSLTFTRGDSAMFTVLVNNPGPAAATLACWLDLNGTKTFTNAPIRTAAVAPGTVNSTTDLDFGTVPASAPDITYLRCRIGTSLATTGSQPSPLGTASDGEVEDYQVQITTPPQQVDWGDAPAPYATSKAVNGPSHVLGSGLVLGTIADAESDGQPGPTAEGDDQHGQSDEDGLDLATVSLPRGGKGSFQVNVTNPLSVPAYLVCWIDLNGDGQFTDDQEKVVDKTVAGSTVSTLAATVHPIQALFTMPRNTPDFTFLRCRVGTIKEEISQPTGPARDGEVEDYQVQTSSPLIDRGDAPDPPYFTLDSHLGAAAVLAGENGQNSGLMLGERVDPEPDAIPNETATGDDDNQVFGYNDEDGVVLPDGQTVLEFTAGQPATLTLKVTNPLIGIWAKLNCWIDFDGDGQFGTSCPTPYGLCEAVDSDPEWVVKTAVQGPFKGQLNPIEVIVPADSTPGDTYMRCRIGTVPEWAIPVVDQPWGLSNDGEVEDYLIHMLPPSTSTP